MVTTESDLVGLDEQRRLDRVAILDSFARQSARDVDGYLATLTEDARVLLPWQPAGFPRELIGHEQIRAAFFALDFHDRYSMTVTVMRPFLEPGRWLVEADMEGDLDSPFAPDHRLSRQHSVVLIRMRGHKIADYICYHNPTVLMSALETAFPAAGPC
ncbi:nuclear transport factor 2 family protein [Nocardia transvalensis]|uniref:nuclear transport factor 2 family protein n=1 Tax=Nocardia transvalensis TaxID=37333 RepID=UPI001894CA63|nr:nuclear transport factor 2 family protein [Nocardia transvalensis]MBF6329659.1 hypothetical protein [Nocardia transvalensis]